MLGFIPESIPSARVVVIAVKDDRGAVRTICGSPPCVRVSSVDRVAAACADVREERGRLRKAVGAGGGTERRGPGMGETDGVRSREAALGTLSEGGVARIG